MTAPPPLVSVILPTRNRADALKRSVYSVLGQTWRNLELIVIDDGSTDGTRALLEAIDDPRLRVIHRAGGAGAAAARNAGIREARGEMLAFQDDDDCWLVQKLELQVRALEQAGPETGWCLGSYVSLERDLISYMGGSRFWNEIDYARGNGWGGPIMVLIATPNWLVRRSALDRAGLFDERLRSWDDWELGLRLERVTRRVHVDRPLYLKDNMTFLGMMKMERARAGDLRLIMEEHGQMWAGQRDVLSRHWYYIGRVESRYDPRPAGRAELWRALRLRPWTPKPWLALGLSYLGARLDAGITRAWRGLRARMGAR